MSTPSLQSLSLALVLLAAAAGSAVAGPRSSRVSEKREPASQSALRAPGAPGTTHATVLIGWIMKAVRTEISSNVLVPEYEQLSLR